MSTTPEVTPEMVRAVAALFDVADATHHELLDTAAGLERDENVDRLARILHEAASEHLWKASRPFDSLDDDHRKAYCAGVRAILADLERSAPN